VRLGLLAGPPAPPATRRQGRRGGQGPAVKDQMARSAAMAAASCRLQAIHELQRFSSADLLSDACCHRLHSSCWYSCPVRDGPRRPFDHPCSFAEASRRLATSVQAFCAMPVCCQSICERSAAARVWQATSRVARCSSSQAQSASTVRTEAAPGSGYGRLWHPLCQSSLTPSGSRVQPSPVASGPARTRFGVHRPGQHQQAPVEPVLAMAGTSRPPRFKTLVPPISSALHGRRASGGAAWLEK